MVSAESPGSRQDYMRTHFTPTVPDEVAAWIRKYLSKRIDPTRLLREDGVDIEAEVERLTAEVREAMRHDLAPGQQRRLIRAAGELHLSGLYEDIVPLADSSSSIFRSAAARALGRLHREDARPVLERLADDPIPEVQDAAKLALSELDKPSADDSGPEEEPDSAPALDPDTVAALTRFKDLLHSTAPPAEPVDSG